MKNKAILLIMALCLMIVGCACFSACNPEGDNGEVGFKVELSYDSTQGTVTASDPSEGKLYDDGEEVTITVSPKQGFAVDKVTVGGGEVALDGGKYSFEISGDTTVSVTFKAVEAATFTVTLNVTPEEGCKAELSPVKDKYAEGEKVTLTATVKAGYAAQVRIDGTLVALNDGKYELTVDGDKVIEVKFVKLDESVLASLQGSVTFEGTRLDKDFLDNTETESTLKTVFDAERNAVLIEAYEDGIADRYWIFVGDDKGKSFQLYHDMYGKVQKDEYDFEFENLFNPFDLLSAGDIENVEGNKWTVSEDKRTAICDAILGYSDTVESFVMYEEGGMIVNIEIVFARFADGFGFSDYQYSFDIDVKEQGTAAIEDEYFEDYATTAEHKALETALDKASKAESYTVKVESEAQSYTLTYTDDGIYVDEKGNERGYAVRPDEKIWRYNISSGEYTFTELVPATSDMNDLKAMFVLGDNNGTYYNLLKSLGNGAFAVRPMDIYISSGQIGSFFAQQIATGSEQISMFSEVYSFEITLKDDMPYTVKMFCPAMEGDVTLTFGDWGTAKLPVTLTEADLAGIIDPKYCGTWSSIEGGLVLNINLDRIEIGGNFVQDLKAEQEGYSFKYNGNDCTIKLGEKGLDIQVGDKEDTLYNCPWVDFIGLFLGTDSTGKDVDVSITAKGIVVTIDKKETEATNIEYSYEYLVDDEGYGESLYVFVFKLGSDEYFIQQYTGGDYDMIVFAKSGSDYYAGLLRDKYEELKSWSDIVEGTFTDKEYTIVITEDKITFTESGKEPVDVENLKFYRDWDYDNNAYYYQFSFEVGSEQYVMELMDHAVVLMKRDGSDMRYLMDESYDEDMSPSYATYKGVDGENKTYTVEISEGGVTITIDGVEHKTTIVYYSIDTFWGMSSAYFVVKAEDGTMYSITAYKEFGGAILDWTKDNTRYSVSLELAQ